LPVADSLKYASMPKKAKGMIRIARMICAMRLLLRTASNIVNSV
jgi:hypothetical protein